MASKHRITNRLAYCKTHCHSAANRKWDPASITNPVAVAFTTTHVPDNNTITLRATSDRAAPVIVSGITVTNNQATGSIELPNGNSLLTAQLTPELTASLGRDYSRYAQGGPVQRIY